MQSPSATIKPGNGDPESLTSNCPAATRKYQCAGPLSWAEIFKSAAGGGREADGIRAALAFAVSRLEEFGSFASASRVAADGQLEHRTLLRLVGDSETPVEPGRKPRKPRTKVAPVETSAESSEPAFVTVEISHAVAGAVSLDTWTTLQTLQFGRGYRVYGSREELARFAANMRRDGAYDLPRAVIRACNATADRLELLLASTSAQPEHPAVLVDAAPAEAPTTEPDEERESAPSVVLKEPSPVFFCGHRIADACDCEDEPYYGYYGGEEMGDETADEFDARIAQQRADHEEASMIMSDIAGIEAP